MKVLNISFNSTTLSVYQCFFWAALMFVGMAKINAQNVQPICIPISMGDQKIYIEKYEKPGESIAFVHVHENETASLEAGLHVWNKQGGKLITIVHSLDSVKNRNITFTWKKTTYQFDPNRIFTEDNALLAQNIKVIKGKGIVNDFVLKEVRNLAQTIWKEVRDYGLILALHNNKNEPGALMRESWFKKVFVPESFSILSYVKKFDIASESSLSCEDIYINPRINNSEFFIVTERRDFALLYKKRYNVVLQNKEPVDDGSMSVYAQKKDKRYVNAEAKMGKVQAQIEMLTLFLE